MGPWGQGGHIILSYAWCPPWIQILKIKQITILGSNWFVSGIYKGLSVHRDVITVLKPSYFWNLTDPRLCWNPITFYDTFWNLNLRMVSRFETIILLKPSRSAALLKSNHILWHFLKPNPTNGNRFWFVKPSRSAALLKSNHILYHFLKPNLRNGISF